VNFCSDKVSDEFFCSNRADAHEPSALLLCHGIVLLWSTIAVTIHCNGIDAVRLWRRRLAAARAAPVGRAQWAPTRLLRPHVLLSMSLCCCLSCASGVRLHDVLPWCVASLALSHRHRSPAAGARQCATALIVALAV
jgi:hypothetical protein